VHLTIAVSGEPGKGIRAGMRIQAALSYALLANAAVGCGEQPGTAVPAHPGDAMSLEVDATDGVSPDARIEATEDVGRATLDAAPTPSAGGSALSRFDERSGSRLRAVWYEAPGGAALFAGWQDTRLDQRCGFAWGADARLRCLPVFTFDASESQCSGHTCNFATRPYGVRDDFQTCPASRAIYQRVAAHPQPGRPDAYDIAEVAPETFVAADLVRGRGDELAPLTLTAEDGASAPWAWQDLRNDVECTFAALETGAVTSSRPTRLHCVPRWEGSWSADDGRFADAACQTPAVELSANPACGARFVRGYRGQCHAGPGSIYRVGKPVAQTYAGSPGACLAIDASRSPSFELGAAVPPDQLGAAEPHLDGSGRVQAIVLDRGGAQARWGLWDRELATVCQPSAVGGPLVCLPQVDRRQLRLATFADAACTQPVLVEQAGCSPPRFYGEAADARAIRRVTQPHTGPVFDSYGPDGACAPALVERGQVAYRLGDLLPRDSFAPLSEVVR
jgi:hypothetical protein